MMMPGRSSNSPCKRVLDKLGPYMPRLPGVAILFCP